MGRYIGGYDGSSNPITSTANQEIIPQPLQNINAKGTNSPYFNSQHSNRTCFYEFNFYNTDACHVKINGENTIYLAPNQNFEIDSNNTVIWSFIVVDSSVHFTWCGSYE